jgi:hypothetical protein
MRARIYSFIALVAITASMFFVGPAMALERTHHGVNCNIIGHRGGTDHRICIMVNRHDTWLWRQALADFCSATNGADYIWVDRIWLERNGRTVRSNSNRRWSPICGAGGRDSISTDWDEFCSPGSPIWQAHMRFALHWKSGGQTNLLEIHSSRDSGLC